MRRPGIREGQRKRPRWNGFVTRAAPAVSCAP
ncbi:predicted protein [Streptomyces sp. C]|nr:predicted protein [Streptomyces sp. C]